MKRRPSPAPSLHEHDLGVLPRPDEKKVVGETLANPVTYLKSKMTLRNWSRLWQSRFPSDLETNLTQIVKSLTMVRVLEKSKS